MKKVGVVVGSIRTGSYTRMVAKALGGLNPNLQCEFLEMPALQMEAYVGNAAKLFDANGNLTNEDTKAFLGKIMQAFGAWIEATAPK